VLADVGDPVEAEAAVSRTRHPPNGTRGYGPRRLSLRHRHRDRRPAVPSVWVQIEGASGVERAGAIASVPGVDAVVVGTADLSFSLGTPLDTGSAPVGDAVAAVRDAAFGVAGAPNGDVARLAAGASILVLGTDARFCAGAVDAAAQQMRDLINATGTSIARDGGWTTP
jgi:4-hydroxy-2-oxoheptanedioate aldolase